MKNYNKTSYINAKGDDNTMTPEAIRETMLNLIREIGGKKITKMIVRQASIAPDCEFSADGAMLIKKLSRLCFYNRAHDIEEFGIPVCDIKTLYHKQYGKNHVINVCDPEGNNTVVDLWIA